MRVDWTPRSLADLDRVEAFLQPKSMAAAVALKKRILTALDLLTLTPRMGAPITHSPGVEIRRIIIDDYEIRYRLKGHAIQIIRLRHSREDQ